MTLTLDASIAGQFFADSEVTGVNIANFEHGQNNGHDYLRVKDFPIFRSGSFEDSMGELTTFDQFLVETIVRNFDYLKDSKVFERPVVRAGHPNTFNNGRMESVIGYIEDIRTENREAPHDHNTYTYVISDLIILDKDAIAKIESGLYLNRSAEIGPYKDNTGAMVGPVMLGVAYVDIPAIEGLDAYEKVEGLEGFFFSKKPETKDKDMSGSSMPNLFTFKIGGNDTQDFSRVQGYITDLESQKATVDAQFAQAQAELTAKDTEISALKEFKDSASKNARADYVNKLVEDKKILASSKDDTLALFGMYTDDQFEAAKKVYDKMAPQALLNNYGNQAPGEQTTPGGGDETKNKVLEYNKGIIASLQRIRKPAEVIKKTPAYQTVIAIDPNFSL
ncbi:capsid maturation protease [Gordonia phage Kampe]|uniref:Capsid maturation protease n=3 Tax=Gordonia phage Orchid TaxID=1838075 RepID=A0A160DJH0_9CAUD|nr:head maturation protease [Gordonia phage Orchid]ANA87247.1 capsid maturation protease [Gordonia phage PatrickStar]ANA87360.1 capsid maturation protease [Gordonia phage Orchid]ANA87474.1 capsid maturation protease [Gordonia phage Kampe]